jgi:hypothetical protein
MLLHVKEALFGQLALKKSEFLKYLALRVLAQREFRLVISLHSCLARKAWLKHSKFLKPRPPFSLLRHILLQLTQWTLRWLSLSPHQKFDEIELSFLHCFFVN